MSTEDPSDEGTLARHLEHLAATADDVAAMLSRPHPEAEIRPEALAKSEQLSTSLKEVIYALTHLEHLAMTGDDVWKALTIKHEKGGDRTLG